MSVGYAALNYEMRVGVIDQQATHDVCNWFDGLLIGNLSFKIREWLSCLRPLRTLKAEGPNDCYRNAERTLGGRLTSHNPAQNQGYIGRLLGNL